MGLSADLCVLTGVYYTFLSWLPEFRSRLENIFVASLFNAQDAKKNRKDKAYEGLTDELISLEQEGITVRYKNQDITLYFLLGLLTGDNEGLNEILCYVDSFIANYYCRICQMSKVDAAIAIKKDVSTLQNETNYQEQLEENDYTTTGIVESCCFRRIPSFQVTKNKVLELLHDSLEGIKRYLLKDFLKSLLSDKLFTHDTLNVRINF